MEAPNASTRHSMEAPNASRTASELLSQGACCKAQQVATTMLEQHPTDLSLHFVLIKSLLHQGQQRLRQALESAREECRQVFGKANDIAGGTNVCASYNLALALAEDNDQEQALKHVNNALELAISSAHELTAPCIALLALLLCARGSSAEALEVIEAGLQEATAALSMEILLLRIKAALLLAQGDAAAALALLAQARRRARPQAQPITQLGVSKLDAPHGLEAQVWQQMVLAYLEQGSPGDAQYCVERMARCAPWSADVQHAAGLVLQAAGMQPLAQQSYEQALALEPNHSGALLSLGTLHADSQAAHDLSAARALLTRGLLADPYSVEGWHQLGLVCRNQGGLEEAEKHLHAATMLSLHSPVLGFRVLPYLLP